MTSELLNELEGINLSVQQKNQLIKTIRKIVKYDGNITNAADEEDITSDKNNLLKLKDRNTLNGMGYIILRRYKSFKEQLTQSNTIYEIRYDFDLGGEEVEIPENCVLKFGGGSLKNGGLIFNNTFIVNGEDSLDSVSLTGNIKNEKFRISWFKYSETKDYAPLLLQALNVSNIVQFEAKTYLFSECYIAKSDVTILGMGDKLSARTTIKAYESGQRYIIKVGGGLNEFGLGEDRVRSFSLSNIYFKGSIDMPLSKNSNNKGEYLSGYLVLDRVEKGYINCAFNNMCNAPAIFVGAATCEVLFDFIWIYNTFTKSDCPAIYFYSLETSDISAITFGKIMVELLCGPIISNSPNLSISELEINSLFFEGNMGHASNYNDKIEKIKTYSPSSNLDTLFEFKEHVFVPLFNVCNASVSIGNMVINNIGTVWKNSMDEDDVERTHALITSTENYFNSSFLSIANLSTFVVSYLPIISKDKRLCVNIANTNLLYYSVIGSKYPIIVLDDAICQVNNDSLIVYEPKTMPKSITVDNVSYLCTYTTEHNIISEPSITIDENNNVMYFSQSATHVIYKPFTIEEDSVLDIYAKISEVIFYVDYYNKNTGELIQTKQFYYKITGYTHYCIPLTKIDDSYIRLRKSGGIKLYVKSITLESQVQDKNLFNIKTDTCLGKFAFDKTYMRPTWWNGQVWIDSSGESIDFLRSGTFNEKPVLPSKGFAYFCTDKQTAEGASTGIMIYHKENDVWVDALGRVIS